MADLPRHPGSTALQIRLGHQANGNEREDRLQRGSGTESPFLYRGANITGPERRKVGRAHSSTASRHEPLNDPSPQPWGPTEPERPKIRERRGEPNRHAVGNIENTIEVWARTAPENPESRRPPLSERSVTLDPSAPPSLSTFQQPPTGVVAEGPESCSPQLPFQRWLLHIVIATIPGSFCAPQSQGSDSAPMLNDSNEKKENVDMPSGEQKNDRGGGEVEDPYLRVPLLVRMEKARQRHPQQVTDTEED
ncbi:hypothetical protein CPLU01_09808 [Colletotrichum plurivorum]|uniref:Uncharacterized protein n=1 Tax=Colletotrichum plurivorum TaxID=2175906 RepID=A0A8H6NB53_9PEZI|nr:hypothetical protein CPLU01_09808 [Colletotrichum plurivorum]